MTWTAAPALGLGFALGLKHALDADHLAAIAVIVGDRRRGLAGASLVGLAWGAGHAAALLAAGLAVILLGVRIPEALAASAELGVGALLAFLGGRLLWTLRRGAVLHVHAHAHDGREHVHPHVHPREIEPGHAAHHPLPGAGSTARPFLVGVLHGMAGSAALMLLVLTTIRGEAGRLAYLIVFALGTTAGMGCMSALVGLPFVLGGGGSLRLQRALRLAAGIVSFALGAGMIWTARPAG